MLKLGALSLLLIVGLVKYIGYKGEPEVPNLPGDQYWGPGKPTKIDESIRPFKIDIPKEVIDDLNKRLERTRSLRKPLEGAGWTYGMNSDYFKTVLEYWRTKYDWSKRQALLNKYPQFKTNIQGLDIHFYHVKPTIPKGSSVRVLPLLLVHGWPGSIVEFQKIIPLLMTPRSNQDFVFEVIAPSLPGYGFSDGATRPGLGNPQVTVLMKNLMTRLGFEQFYTQGGDWGSIVTANMGVLYPKRNRSFRLSCRSGCIHFGEVQHLDESRIQVQPRRQIARKIHHGRAVGQCYGLLGDQFYHYQHALVRREF